MLTPQERLEGLLAEGQAQLKARRFEAAFATFSQTIYLLEKEEQAAYLPDVALADLYATRGQTLWETDFEAAYEDPDIFHQILSDYEQALELNPHFPQYLWRRGELYRNSKIDKYVEEARQDFEAILENDKDHLPSLQSLGELYLAQEQYPRAIEYFTKALDQQPEHPNLRRLRGQSYMQQVPPNFHKAAQDLGIAQQQMPELDDLYVWRAQAFQQLGETNLAIEEYDRLLDLRPGNVGYYVDRGVLHLEVNENEALADFDRALEIAPHPLAYNNRAYLLRQQGYLDEAVEDAQAALQTDPSYTVAWATLAEIYADMGNRTRMYETLEKAVNTYYEDVLDLMTEPAFEPYLQEPEFQALLRQA